MESSSLYINMVKLYACLEQILTRLEEDNYYYQYEKTYSDKDTMSLSFEIINETTEASIFKSNVNYKFREPVENLDHNKELYLIYEIKCDFLKLWEVFAKDTLNFPYINKLFFYLNELEEMGVTHIDDELLTRIRKFVINYGAVMKSVDKDVGVEKIYDHKRSFFLT